MNYHSPVSETAGPDEVLKDKLTPKAIVAALNEHIVGQNDAKKAVAVALRNLEAMMIVADAEQLLILTGNGDVLEPEAGIAAIGSGGNYALAAARALTDYEQDPERLARRAMAIAAEVCVFTNDRLTIETVE